MADQNVTPHKFGGRKISGGLSVGIIIIAIIVIAVFSSFYTVNANELGVVTRFGK